MRLRDHGVTLGRFAPGPRNAITDVPGVRVGHATIREDREDGSRTRTGVTAILPRDGDIFHDRAPAGHFVLNGAGEMSGLIQVAEWGLIETPVMLTNTMAVGAVSAAVARYMLKTFPGIGSEHDVIIPLVGECDDSYLNDVSQPAVLYEHVEEAIASAADGDVSEGSVGAGTGMMTCDFSAGIGTSSRVVPHADGAWTLGLLVLSNFGEMKDLRLDGVPVGSWLEPRHVDDEKRRQNYGSIIAVAATDAPLSPKQLDRVCKRIALGIGRTGSYAAHGSGEIVTAFSIANTVPRETTRHSIAVVPDRSLNPLYEAAIECVEEAIWNALAAGGEVHGTQGNKAPAVPMADVAALWKKTRALVEPST